MLSKEIITEAVARGWCADKNSSKTMDSDLAMVIVDEIMKLPGITNLDVEQELVALY